MKRFALLIGIPAVLLLAACNQADEAPATQSRAAAPASAAQSASADIHDDHAGHDHAAQDDHAADEGHADGTAETAAAAPITLASGEQVEIIGVGYFDENIKSLDGLVAIEGRVKESHPDRGALILIDCSVEAGCTDGCCPEAEVPVRLDLSNYTGGLPAADTEVVVVGDLTVSDLGYELAVREIRQGEETLLALKS